MNETQNTSHKQKPLLIGYVQSLNLAAVKAFDAKALDVINIASGHVDQGICTWQAGENMEVQTVLDQLRSINPKLKFVLSIGGLTAGGFSVATASQESRERFANSATDLILRHKLDGIDIDWEYPGISVSAIESNPSDKENFTFFLQAIRDALDTNREHMRLTIAAGGDEFFCRNTEMHKVAEICDYIQIMTYDLRGIFSHATGHHTNLFTPQNDFHNVSVKTAVEAYLAAGVPREKLVIGAAFYSRLWKGVPGADNGYNQNAVSIGDYGPSYDVLVDEYIGPDGHGINGFKRYWDESAKAPWLYNGDQFITYDDPQSIREKVKYLKAEGLLGIMFWEYRAASKHRLTQVIREVINEG